AIKDHTSMGLQRPGNHIRRVSVGAAICGRADTPFGVGFQHEAAEIRYGAINLIDFGFPPGNDRRTQWVECIQPAKTLWAAEIYGHRDLYTPEPERIRNKRDIGKQICAQHPRIRIHVIDRAAVDAERCEHSCVISHAAEVSSSTAVLPKNGWP